tara:strand:+ start:74418 stop:75164 length:747 start_codon:yes stop_codon:yes gene_type:complete
LLADARIGGAAVNTVKALQMKNVRTKLIPILSCLVFACGGGGDDGEKVADGGGGGGTDSSTQSGLTCSSLALCTSFDVKQFLGEDEVATGGSIADGTYVLAWEVTSDPSEDASEGYYSSVSALVISGGEYVGAGFSYEGAGTISTSGTTLTLHKKRSCGLGEDFGESDYTSEFEYTATSDRLILHSPVQSSNGLEWINQRVFLRRGADQICTTVADEPTSPGESAQCHVSNCYCNVAENGTVDNDLCQ